MGGFFKLPLGITLLPGLDETDGQFCTARDCQEIARLRLFMGDEGDLGVNVVCSFHALVYVGLAVNDLVVREGEAEGSG